MATIAGLFPDRIAAERAISELLDAGFDRDQIGFVMRDQSGRPSTAEQTGVGEEHVVSSAAGAATGAAIGGTLGAILAATGALVVPGIGPIISGGILATALVGGAAGWLVGGLVGLGVPREEAEYYQGRVEQGSALVTVNATGSEEEAQQILLRNGAEDLRSRGWGYTAPAERIVYSQGQVPTKPQAPAQPGPAATEADYGANAPGTPRTSTGTSLVPDAPERRDEELPPDAPR
jgi:hypothetical protein